MSETPSNPTYCLHGFSFTSEAKRQKSAEEHEHWVSFVEYYNRVWDNRPPEMKFEDDRRLFEFYIEGAFREFTTTDAAAKAALIEEASASLTNILRYRSHGPLCKINETDFCTCGLKEVADATRALLAKLPPMKREVKA